MESVCTFRLGFNFLMQSISSTKQSDLSWHFLRILKWLSFKRSFLPCASWKCSRISNFCVQKYAIRQICPGLNANEIQIPCYKHHKMSSLIESHQNTHNSVKYDWSNMKMLNNPAIYEVTSKQYLRSILDISAIRGPRGEPIATPSACSYNWPSIWKRRIGCGSFK